MNDDFRNSNQESEQSNTNGIDSLSQERATKSNAIEIPSISLPKGGGALKGIDEKFKVNAANGAASISIPLPVSPGRNGFSPSLALSYNSGGGNSPFGLGWNVDLPKIQRKTDKGIPQYKSGIEEDTFQFSGAEDLVPLLDYDAGNWIPRIIDNAEFTIHQYRPRIEGGFARIQRIKRKVDNQTYWKVTTRDNTTLYFGISADTRIDDPEDSLIVDPEDSSRVFAWLPDFSHDDKGNWIQYEYQAENLDNISNSVNERNRRNGNAPFTNRYLKRVKYGNRASWYSDNPYSPTLPESTAEYFFELILDYGEHKNSADSDQIPVFESDRFKWEGRPDAFSSYRSGFEIRTYRRCHNILMFHHFPDEEQFSGTSDEESFGRNYLVRSLSLNYEPSSINDSGQTEVSYLQSITQTGFIRRDGSYFQKSLPPLEYEYQSLDWNTEVHEVDNESIANAPVGLTNGYQWVDLYGEGINGILTEQGEGWYYKSNLGDVDEDKQVRFTKAKKVSPKPSFMGLSSGFLSLQDLESNGQKQIVANGPGIHGYFELTADTNFESFRSFETIANINLQDPNVRLLDLNGDGKPEIVMTEENVFSWFPSKGKKGHDKAKISLKPYDDEMGPAIVFADQEQSIFLADMCGDGLTDIVRIRNGEICYWANKGYGNFSAKVNMDNAPVFDYPEQFNPKYIQLADISGTGASDIIYLGQNKFKAYINLTGNAFSNAHEIAPFFPIDSNSQISVIDLLGTGTSCIVWSSDLPAESHSPMRYMDLMDSKKPHVLKKHVNNLGMETTLEYKSSTWYYLKDKLEGTPWITKLPFPVQVISKTIIEDKITDVRFTAEYSYHHGYYDHPEREFRGFGMVEQWDTEAYESWNANNAGNRLEQSEDLYQAPTLTKTWFHNGAFLDRERILSQYKEEYWYEEYNNAFPDTPIVVTEPELQDARMVSIQTLAGIFDISNLSTDEYREGLRACKGMMLRQEVFSLDAPIENPSHEERQKQYKPYTVATHNCHIQLLQPKSENDYASFIVTESEAITISYERDETDPRIAHTLNIQLDEFGNVLQAVSVVYPRLQENADLPEKIREKQAATLITYMSNIFTNDIIQDDVYRLRQPSESETFEITGLLKSTVLYQLNDFENILAVPANQIEYHHSSDPNNIQIRPIEHVRSLYYNEELTGSFNLNQLSTHGIPYESYQLAYTPDLLTTLFGTKIIDPNKLLEEEGKFVPIDGDWWIRSGKPLFIDTSIGEDLTTARDRFFTPSGYLSPFNVETNTFYYKDYFLMLEASEDALENRSEVQHFNFRMLSPISMQDINDNISEVVLDELGLPKAMAVLGKGEEADSLIGLTEFTTETERDAIQNYFTLSETELLRTSAQNLLHGATTRFVYNYNRYRTSVQLLQEQFQANPGTELCARVKLLPTVTGSMVREQHYAINRESPLQLSFQYSDGMGNVAMAKSQAEPGEALNLIIAPNCDYTVETVDTDEELRWLGNGRTILNNKGNPVKQYEPYFSVNPFYEDNKELVEHGVTPIIYYDAIGRNIRTELPDGTFTKVEFDSWQQASYDQNDTVRDSQWYIDRGSPVPIGRVPDDTQQRAAWQSAVHHNTPSVIHLDTLGRPVLSIAHNRIEERDNLGNLIGVSDEFYQTLIHLDIEGNAQSIVDDRNNTVMEYSYDMLGHRVYQKSMDAGKRWMFNNAIGNPIRSWDSKDQLFSTTYDVLQRPVEMILQTDDGNSYLIEKIRYGESAPNAKLNNLRGQVAEHSDSSGRMINVAFDLKGNLLEERRNLATIIDEPIIDWTIGAPTNLLDEEENFTIITQYDALNRMTRLYNWHRTPDRVAVYLPTYNERGVLVSEDHSTAAQLTDVGFEGGNRVTAVSNITYNEKGQRMRMRSGNHTNTRYHYDPLTFRLMSLRTTGNLSEAPQNATNPNVIQDLVYTYDAMGNITEIEDNAYEPVFFRNQHVEPKSRYRYDALYRLIRAEGRENDTFNTAPGPVEQASREAGFPVTDKTLRNYTQHYQYDAVGNILEMRHIADGLRWTRNYVYAADSNRLFSTTVGSQTVVYDYDNHGSMKNYNNSPEEYFPHWDYKDRVHSIHLGGGGQAWYQYDTSLERSRKRIEKTDGTTEERIYLGGAEVYRRWKNGNKVEEIETHHFFVDDQRVLIVEDVLTTDNQHLTTNTLYRYQYSNHLGSVGLELNEDTAIISYEEYHPYGTVAYQATNTSINAIAKRYRYTGMERDAESGLNYHSARYYLPWLGRWLSADPIGVAGGINLYSYALNNPINLGDVDGLQPVEVHHRTSSWDRIFGVLKMVGGAFEIFVGGSLIAVGLPTSEIGIGLLPLGAGTVVGAHGLDTVQAGFRQTFGIATRDDGEVDTLTSEFLQDQGVDRTSANLVDAGIGILGTAGGGVLTASTKLSNLRAAEPILTEGMSNARLLVHIERGSQALSTADYTRLGGETTSALAKRLMIENGVDAAGNAFRLTTTVRERAVSALSLLPTGLTPLAEIGVGFVGALAHSVTIPEVLASDPETPEVAQSEETDSSFQVVEESTTSPSTDPTDYSESSCQANCHSNGSQRPSEVDALFQLPFN